MGRVLYTDNEGEAICFIKRANHTQLFVWGRKHEWTLGQVAAFHPWSLPDTSANL